MAHSLLGGFLECTTKGQTQKAVLPYSWVTGHSLVFREATMFGYS